MVRRAEFNGIPFRNKCVLEIMITSTNVNRQKEIPVARSARIPASTLRGRDAVTAEVGDGAQEVRLRLQYRNNCLLLSRPGVGGTNSRVGSSGRMHCTKEHQMIPLVHPDSRVAGNPLGEICYATIPR